MNKNEKNNRILKSKVAIPTTNIHEYKRNSKFSSAKNNDYPNDIQGLFEQLGI